jgi:YgiT-type zinc finger domain-containing protein
MKELQDDMAKSRPCMICKSRMVLTKVEHPYWHDNVLVALINEVPSWVCQLCGHRYFEPGVESSLQVIVRDYIKLGKTFPIPTTLYRSTHQTVAI